MADNAYHLKWNHHMQNMYRQLDTLFIQQEFVDVTLSCTDGLLKAHRLILSACSPYFENVFKHNTCKHPILILKGISTKEMGSLLKFMYKGYVEVLDDDLHSFISTANELKIRGLADELLKDSLQGNDQEEKYDAQGIIAATGALKVMEGIKLEKNSQFDILNGMQDEGASLRNNTEKKIVKTEDVDQKVAVSSAAVSNLEIHSASSVGEAATAISDACSEAKVFTTETSIPYPRDTRFKGRKRVSVGFRFDGIEEECKQGCCETIIRKRHLETQSSRPGKSALINMLCSERPKTEKNDMSLLSINPLSGSPVKKEKEDVAMFCISSLSEFNAGVGSDVEEDKKNLTICAFCSLDCHTSAELKKHVRVHTGEKPYECDLCNLAFSRASHLARHRRVHTGERPFTCLCCGRKFSRQDKLKQHARRHHDVDGHNSYGTGSIGRTHQDAGKLQRPRGRPRIKFDAPAGNKTSGDNTIGNNSSLLPFGDTRYLSSLSLGQQHFEDLTISPVTEPKQIAGQNAAEDLLQTVRQLGECTIQTYSGKSENLAQSEATF